MLGRNGGQRVPPDNVNEVSVGFGGRMYVWVVIIFILTDDGHHR